MGERPIFLVLHVRCLQKSMKEIPWNRLLSCWKCSYRSLWEPW